MIKVIETEIRHPITGEKLKQDDVNGEMVEFLVSIFIANPNDNDCFLTATEDGLQISIYSIGFFITLHDLDKDFLMATNTICKHMIWMLAYDGLNKNHKDIPVG